MHIRQREAVFQLFLRLIGLEEHAHQAATCYFLLKAFLLITFTNDEKNDVEPMPLAFRRIEQDAELMRAAEIAGIADDETLRHVPLRAERIDRAQPAPPCANPALSIRCKRFPGVNDVHAGVVEILDVTADKA